MTLPRSTFDQQIEAARQRLETLQQHAGESPGQTALAMEALEELSNALEELYVAGEELRQQNDELAASRQAVEVERQRYVELFEFAPDGYLVTDPEGVIQEANRAAAALLGVRQDFLVGKPLLVFVADVRAGHAAFHMRLTQLQKAQTDKLQDWQIWLQPREGGPFPAEVTVGRVYDAYSRLTGLRWLLRDITRRKRAEESLQLSEAHYRAIVEDQTEFILRFLPDGSLTFVNGAYCRHLGKTHEEMMDRSQVLLTPVADRKEIKQQFALLTPENPATTYELRAALPGGQMGWQQWTTRALYDDEGNLVEYQSVGRDITEHKQIDEALQQSNRRLALLNRAIQTLAATLDLDRVLVAILEEMRRLLDADNCIVWLVDPETDELICRQSAGPSKSVRGWRLAAGQGMASWVASSGKGLVVPDTLKDERYYEGIEQAVGFAPRSVLSAPMWVQQRVVGVLQALDADPNRYTETDLRLAEPLAAAAATAIVNAQLYERAQQEIAERRRAEEVLHQQALELEARNTELDAFDHTVAHDLKNPLSLVLGFSEALENDHTGLSREELRRHLHAIARNAGTMGRIIDELLLLAGVRKTQATVSPLDMPCIVDEARLRISELIEECQAEIVLPEASAWPVALGHAEWIVEVWANYLSNSIKYGGQPPRVTLGAEVQPDGMVRFWVRDNGHGLSPEEQARLFTPFTRLDQVRAKGHGLGLSIVRRIVVKLGGQVGVESQIGQGSSFFFTLPGEVSPTMLTAAESAS